MYTIGIDLGGTNIKAGVVDSGCHIVGTAKCKTALPRSTHHFQTRRKFCPG